MNQTCCKNFAPLYTSDMLYDIDEEDENALSIIRSSITDILSNGGQSQNLDHWNDGINYSQHIKQISVGPRCNRCGNPCGDDVIYQGNLAFHTCHFTCRNCNEPLKVAISVNNEIYCQKCASQVLPQSNCCCICNAPRNKSSVIAGGRCYCKEHFRCATCNKILDIASFRQYNGHFYCQEHCPDEFLPICAGCSRQIIGSKVICACSNNKYHPECFNCIKCGKSLVDQKYTQYEGNPICVSCFKQLPKGIKTYIAMTQSSH